MNEYCAIRSLAIVPDRASNHFAGLKSEDSLKISQEVMVIAPQESGLYFVGSSQSLTESNRLLSKFQILFA